MTNLKSWGRKLEGINRLQSCVFRYSWQNLEGAVKWHWVRQQVIVFDVLILGRLINCWSSRMKVDKYWFKGKIWKLLKCISLQTIRWIQQSIQGNSRFAADRISHLWLVQTLVYFTPVSQVKFQHLPRFCKQRQPRGIFTSSRRRELAESESYSLRLISSHQHRHYHYFSSTNALLKSLNKFQVSNTVVKYQIRRILSKMLKCLPRFNRRRRSSLDTNVYSKTCALTIRA